MCYKVYWLFIIALCGLIRRLAVDRLYIIGDVFDLLTRQLLEAILCCIVLGVIGKRAYRLKQGTVRLIPFIVA